MTDEQKSEIQGRLELVRAAKQQKAAGGAGVEFAQDTLNGDELTAVLGAEPPPEPAEPGRPAGLTEKQWRLLRAACEVEAEGAVVTGRIAAARAGLPPGTNKMVAALAGKGLWPWPVKPGNVTGHRNGGTPRIKPAADPPPCDGGGKPDTPLGRIFGSFPDLTDQPTIAELVAVALTVQRAVYHLPIAAAVELLEGVANAMRREAR